MTLSALMDDLDGFFDAGDLDVRRVTLGVSLLDCASQLRATVAARAYDKVRRTAGAFRRAVDDVAAYYGFGCEENSVAVTPISVVADSLPVHDLTAVAQALDAAAVEADVATVRGFATIGSVEGRGGCRSLAEAIPGVVASTKRVFASIDCGTEPNIDLASIRAYARVVKTISELSVATADYFLRVQCGPSGWDTCLYHPIEGPEASISVEISCARQIVELLKDAPEGPTMSERERNDLVHSVRLIALRRARAAQFIRDRIVESMAGHSGTTVSPGAARVSSALTGMPSERSDDARTRRQLLAQPHLCSLADVVTDAIWRANLTAGDNIPGPASRSSRADGQRCASCFSDFGSPIVVPREASADEIVMEVLERLAARPDQSQAPVSVLCVDAAPDEQVELPGFGDVHVSSGTPQNRGATYLFAQTAG